jgi:hypothetical protein
VPGDSRADTFPNDWFVPPPTVTPNTGQFPPGAQPNTANSGSPYPAVRPDPFAAYWSQIPASRIGAMAWAPPYLPPFSPSSTNNFPAPTPPFAPPIPPGSWPRTLGVDSPQWSSTQSPPSPAIPKGGLLGGLATLGTSPPATPPIPPGGGLLGGLATLGTPSPSTPDWAIPSAAFMRPPPSTLAVPVNDQAATRPWWIPPGPNSVFDPWADQFIKGMQGLIHYFRSRQSLGDPDAPGCKEEWDDARQQCAKWLAQPNPPRGFTGGHRNVEDCARGHVSERCGGNPFDR